MIYIDIETNGFRPLHNAVVAISLLENNTANVFSAYDYRLKDVAALIHNKSVCIHHARFDLSFILVHYGATPSKVDCTMTAARLLLGNTYTSISQLARHYLGMHVDKQMQRTFSIYAPLTSQQVDYCKRDVELVKHLYTAMLPQLNLRGLYEEYRKRCDSIIPSIRTEFCL